MSKLVELKLSFVQLNIVDRNIEPLNGWEISRFKPATRSACTVGISVASNQREFENAKLVKFGIFYTQNPIAIVLKTTDFPLNISDVWVNTIVLQKGRWNDRIDANVICSRCNEMMIFNKWDLTANQWINPVKTFDSLKGKCCLGKGALEDRSLTVSTVLTRPFGIKLENGSVVGLDMSLFNIIAKKYRINVKYRFERSWSKTLPNGEVIGAVTSVRILFQTKVYRMIGSSQQMPRDFLFTARITSFQQTSVTS